MRLLLLLLVLPLPVFSQAVRDDYGNTVRVPKAAQRIVTLSPHLTELVYAAGAGDRMVGAVEYSDYPPQAKTLPRVGAETINLEAVLALKPDLVIGWPNVGSAKAIDRLAELKIPTFRSEPRELDDIASTLERIGWLAGTEVQAARAAGEFRGKAEALEKRYAGRPKVRVFYQVWDKPLQTVNGDHVISKVMRMCGGENVFARLPLLAPEIDREAVLKADPQVIVASGEQGLEQWKRYPGLAAAAKRHLYVIAPDLIQRHTPRLLEGAGQLCDILERVRARS